MEGLSNLFQTAKVKGWIRGFQVGNNTSNNQEITHLPYADDALVFCDAVEEQMLILRVIFKIFEAISGGRLTLVNSVLDALPSYMMSLFHIQAKATKSWMQLGGTFYGKEAKIRERTIWSNGRNCLYASCDTVTRRELWQELSNIKEVCSDPWVSCGDYNVTRYPNERSEGHRITGDMQEFTEWINAMEFMDPLLLGDSFTSRRGDGHSSASRTDRFLYSSQWDESFTQIKQNLLPRIGSDHNPIMLDCGELNSNKSYFKFEQWWLRVDGFADKVKEWWFSFNINGTDSYILATKLRILKQKLKEWRLTHRNDWKHKEEEIFHQLAEMEKTQELS
ncbi:hypothetical protein MTR67_036059 [Solanum verrucosum]|uniref:Uncharacterized protein n=1 Tax=Solanum verrucosum TaxID=315347 RepID=A0AAF0UBT4_SOLVR|nr:hypothetical protein MTR67_036059 [Solanum verrucosum]